MQRMMRPASEVNMNRSEGGEIFMARSDARGCLAFRVGNYRGMM